jgi:hypothetical protein
VNIRVFVSSTFRDMHAERDPLNRFVFPELRSRSSRRGVDFAGVDLRWGITAGDARLLGTTRTCLDEIDRCRPFFLSLLGDRYGWIPPPEVLAVDDFDKLKQFASTEPDLTALLDAWYRLDETLEPPVWKIRSDAIMPALVLDRLTTLCEAAGLEAAGQSLTEREIRYGALGGPAGTHAFIYVRRPEFLDDPLFPDSFRPSFPKIPSRLKLLHLPDSVDRLPDHEFCAGFNHFNPPRRVPIAPRTPG